MCDPDNRRLDGEITKISCIKELEKKEIKDAKIKIEKEKVELESKLEKLSKDKGKMKDAKCVTKIFCC